MTTFSNLYAKVNDLKNKVEQHSISPLYLGTLLDEFIQLMQSIGISSAKDSIPPATMDAVYGAINHKHDGREIKPASIELISTTPYIDFHHNASEEDFTIRLVEGERGKLSVQGPQNEPISFVMNGAFYAHSVESWGNGGCYFHGPMRGGNSTRQPHSASYVITYGDGGTHHYGMGWDTVSHTARIGACTNNGEWIDADLNFSFKGNVYAKNISTLELQLQDCLERIEALESKHPQTT